MNIEEIVSRFTSEQQKKELEIFTRLGEVAEHKTSIVV
jgi:hypothetical protein